MNQLLPSITKSKLPAGEQFPLKYSDLEGCLTPHLTGNVGVSLHFNRWRVYGDTARELILPDGDFHLVQMKLNPEQPHWSHQADLWGEPGAIPVLDVWVYALPCEVLRDAGLDHVLLRNELALGLARLAGAGLWTHRWELRCLLRGDLRELECWEHTWTGLRAEDERRHHVPLDPERERSHR